MHEHVGWPRDDTFFQLLMLAQIQHVKNLPSICFEGRACSPAGFVVAKQHGVVALPSTIAVNTDGSSLLQLQLTIWLPS